MELIILVSSATLHEDIMEMFKNNAITSYTLLPHVLGSGAAGGTRLDTQVWPGENQIFLLALPAEQTQKIKKWVREYRSNDLREGLKLFNLELKEII